MCDSVTADMSYKRALAAEILRGKIKHRFPLEAKTGNRGRSSLASGSVTDTGKVSMLLGDEGDKEAVRGPENPKRFRDFLVEKVVKELSLPVYDPNRGPMHPQELYALIHVIFSDTNIQVY